MLFQQSCRLWSLIFWNFTLENVKNFPKFQCSKLLKWSKWEFLPFSNQSQLILRKIRVVWKLLDFHNVQLQYFIERISPHSYLQILFRTQPLGSYKHCSGGKMMVIRTDINFCLVIWLSTRGILSLSGEWVMEKHTRWTMFLISRSFFSADATFLHSIDLIHLPKLVYSNHLSLSRKNSFS